VTPTSPVDDVVSPNHCGWLGLLCDILPINSAINCWGNPNVDQCALAVIDVGATATIITKGVKLAAGAGDALSKLFGGGEDAAAAAGTASDLGPQIDKSFQFPGAGRSGAGVKTLSGRRTRWGASQGRVFVTDDQGRVVFDITRDRVKPVFPGQGFVSGDGRKLAPTSQQLGWIDELWARDHG
jgi:hypothetical protein